MKDPLEESLGPLLGGARRKESPLPWSLPRGPSEREGVRLCQASEVRPSELGYLFFLVRMLIRAKLQPNKQTNKVPRVGFARRAAEEGGLKGSFMTRGDFERRQQ